MKAQLEHSFTFIMFIVVAGVVLLFGYRMIANVGDQACEMEELELASAVDNYLRSYAKFGTMKFENIPARCQAQQLCFVNAEFYGTQTNGIYVGTPASDPIVAAISNAVIRTEIIAPSTPPHNVFVIYDSGTVPLQLWSEKIRTYDHVGPVACINETGGNFKVTFEGQGLQVLVNRTV